MYFTFSSAPSSSGDLLHGDVELRERRRAEDVDAFLVARVSEADVVDQPAVALRRAARRRRRLPREKVGNRERGGGECLAARG